MKKGWYWPFLLGALLVGGVGANIYFLCRALGDPSFAIEPDYYGKAIRWDAHQAQERENRELGWAVTLDVSPADAAHPTSHVVAHIRDRSGAALPGLAVALEAFHNARAGDVVEARLAEDGAHDYVADAAILRPGLWEFRITAQRDGATFTAVLDQDAPGWVR